MPWILELIADLTALLIVVLASMLLFGYKISIGAMLQLLAKVLDVSILTKHPFGFLSDAVLKIDSEIRNALGQFVLGSHWVWDKVLNANAYVWSELSHVVADLAVATERGLKHGASWTWHQIKAAYITPLIQDYHTLSRLLHEARAEVNHLAHATTTTVPNITRKYVDRSKHIIEIKVAAIPSAIGHAAGGALPRIRPLEREVTSIEKWVKSHGKLLTEVGIAGLVAGALSRLGYSQRQCSRMKKYTNGICGMNDDLLEAFLAGTLVLGSTISIVEFAKYCQGFLGEVEEPLDQFVRELRDVKILPAVKATTELANYAAGKY